MKKATIYSLILILLLCIACALLQGYAHWRVAAYEESQVAESRK